MAAPKGNKFAEGNPGTKKEFETPEDLYLKFEAYKKDVNDNPWIKYEVVKSGDFTGQLLPVPNQRPYTLRGFAVFCNMSFQGILNYGNMPGYEDYFDVYSKIENECTNQKFDGATVGAFNANIIARDLGLTEKSDITSAGDKIENQTIINLQNFSDDDLRAIADLQRKIGISEA